MWGVLIIIAVIIFIVPNVIDAMKEADKKARYEEELRVQRKNEEEEKRKEEEAKQKRLQEQKDLVVHYKNSMLIQEVIQTICNGNSKKTLPEKIVITNNYIQGINNGQTLTYDFATHRVKSFPYVIKSVLGWDELKFVVRPQVAMADALNLLLNNRYVIQNISKQDYQRCTYSDGEPYTVITYTSDHVTMVLKSTLPNKEF